MALGPLALACGQDRPLPEAAAAQELALGATAVGTLRAGHQQRFAFAPGGTGPVTVALDSFDFDAVLSIEDSAGKRLLEDDAGGVGTNARAVLEAQGGATYAVVVASRAGGGEFALTLTAGSVPRPEGAALVDAGIAFYEEAAARAQSRGDPRAEMQHRIQLGSQLLYRSRFADARLALEAGVALAGQTGDRVSEASANLALSNISLALADFPHCREEAERSLELFRSLGDKRGVALANLAVGNVLEATGERDGARERFDESRRVAQEIGDRSTELMAVATLANCYFRSAEFARSREAYDASLALARSIGDRRREAWILGNFGNLEARAGDPARARELYSTSLELVRALGDRALEAQTLGNLGLLCISTGAYADARDYLEQQLERARELGERGLEARALGRLGFVYYCLGEFASAREAHAASLAMKRELGLSEGVASSIGGLAVAAQAVGEFEEAREHCEEWRRISREEGDRSSESSALQNLGNALTALERFDEARSVLEEALALARETGERRSEALVLVTLGDLEMARDAVAAAGNLAAKGLAIFRELGLEHEQILPLATVARAAVARGEPTPAHEALAEAKTLLDRSVAQGGGIAEGSGVRSRHAEMGWVAQDLTALRIRQATTEEDRDRITAEGFREEGLWKGRMLLAGIAEHRRGERTAEATRLRRERRETLAQRDAALVRLSEAVRSGRPADERALLEDEIAALLARSEELAGALAQSSPRDSALDRPPTPEPGAVVGALPGDVLLVEFAEGERRLYAYAAWQGGVRFVDLGERDAIAREVLAFLELVVPGGSLGSPAAIAERGGALHARLIAPVLAAAGAPPGRLLIVPSPTLAALPFEALVAHASAAPASFADLEFVIDRFEVSYAPSSAVLVELATCASRADAGRVLVLADPVYPAEAAGAEPAAAPGSQVLASLRVHPAAADLGRIGGTRAEGLAIGRLLLDPSEREAAAALADLEARRSGSLSTGAVDLHLGAEASRARLESDLRSYGVLHLAAHGYADPALPQGAGLALSFGPDEDGFFPVGRALELDLDANLVVLSACETARGRLRAGEGVESMARAFLYAGARGVIASLWSVEDWAAAETMSAFYRKALHEGLAPARALREAKVELRVAAAERAGRRPSLASAEGSETVRGMGAVSAELAVDPAHPCFWAPFIHIGLPR